MAIEDMNIVMDTGRVTDQCIGLDQGQDPGLDHAHGHIQDQEGTVLSRSMNMRRMGGEEVI